MTLSIDLTLTNLGIMVAIYFATRMGFSSFKSWRNKKKLGRWSEIPPNVVILHGVPRAFSVPSASPYCLKLETYLRMAKISYELDTSDPFSVQGKTPWISFKDEDTTVHHIPDSQFAIEFLQKKFGKIPQQFNYSKSDQAIGRALRILLETHFVFGYAQWRWIDGFHTIQKVTPLPFIERHILGTVLPPAIRKSMWYHGIGRHSMEDIYRLTKQDLRTVSHFMDTKKFLLGDEPCDEDCSIFGMLAQMTWAASESPFERLINSELTNIREYCERMKNKFWPDWNECLYNNRDKVQNIE